MPPGEVLVNGRIGKVPVPERHLYAAQVGTGFQHSRRETMAQRMRRDALLNACPFPSRLNRQYVRGFIQRQYSRMVSRSVGLSRTSLSRAPLP